MRTGHQGKYLIEFQRNCVNNAERCRRVCLSGGVIIIVTRIEPDLVIPPDRERRQFLSGDQTDNLIGNGVALASFVAEQPSNA